MTEFSELTGRWTHDISLLAADCRQRRGEIETRRLAALAALPGAKAAMAAFEAERQKASAARDDAIRRAEQARASKEHDADADASDARNEDARRRSEADGKALDDRDEAIAAARDKRNARLAEIHKLPLSLQAPLLHDADAAHASAIASARAGYNRGLLDSHEAMQAKARERQDDARIARERAAEQCRRQKQAAEDTFRAEMQAAESRRRLALEALPEAVAVESVFDAERLAVDADCRRREDELLAAYRRARAALGVPDGRTAGPPR